MKYVTETWRHLGRAGNLRVFEGVRATVSDLPNDANAKEREFKPAEWRSLLREPDVMYRYRNEPYRRPINM